MRVMAACLRVTYEPGTHETVETSAGIGPDSVVINGVRYVNRGTGFAERITPSRLILYVEVDDRMYEIWVTKFFHGEWKRLTLKRKVAIQATMPREIAVSEHTSPRGGRYYEALHADLVAWLTRAKAYRYTPPKKS